MISIVYGFCLFGCIDDVDACVEQCADNALNNEVNPGCQEDLLDMTVDDCVDMVTQLCEKACAV